MGGGWCEDFVNSKHEVDKGKLTTVANFESWRFEREPFVRGVKRLLCRYIFHTKFF